uniref:LisH domain-containing protein n=1 Tax=Rhabditophanes sp. KR3021 TaxID=114890 RepID=A0AC35TPC3_9BILA
MVPCNKKLFKKQKLPLHMAPKFALSELPEKDENYTELCETSWFKRTISGYCDISHNARMEATIYAYLISEGYKNAAESFARETGLEFTTEMARLLTVRAEIKRNFLDGKIMEAYQLITDNYSNFKEKFPNIVFKILLQHITELIRQKNAPECFRFGQEHVIPLAENSKEMTEIMEQTFSMIVFDEPLNSPYGHLMAINNRIALSEEVHDAIIEISAKPKSPCIEHLFKVMVLYKMQSNGHELNDIFGEKNKESVMANAREFFGNDLESFLTKIDDV